MHRARERRRIQSRSRAAPSLHKQEEGIIGTEDRFGEKYFDEDVSQPHLRYFYRRGWLQDVGERGEIVIDRGVLRWMVNCYFWAGLAGFLFMTIVSIKYSAFDLMTWLLNLGLLSVVLAGKIYLGYELHFYDDFILQGNRVSGRAFARVTKIPYNEVSWIELKQTWRRSRVLIYDATHKRTVYIGIPWARKSLRPALQRLIDEVGIEKFSPDMRPLLRKHGYSRIEVAE